MKDEETVTEKVEFYTPDEIASETGKCAAAVRYAGREMPNDMAYHLPNGRWFFTKDAIAFMNSRTPGKIRLFPKQISVICPVCKAENHIITSSVHDELICKQCNKKLLT